MRRASKITRVAALAAAVVVGSVGTAWSEEAPQREAPRGEGPKPLVWPVPPIVPRQPRLGFYGHLERGWGMMVDYVPWGTPAFRTGLEPGDVIVRINRQRILSYRDYYLALRTSGPICRLLVDDVRGRGRVWVVCHLHRHPRPLLAPGSRPRPPAPSPKKRPPHTFTPPPEKSPSAKPESSKGPLL